MLSKMAQPNNVGGGGGGGSGASGSSGRRLPLSLSGGSTVSRLQQSSTGSNGRSNSPQNGNNKKITESFIPLKKTSQQRPSSTSSSSSSNAREEDKKSQNGAPKPTNGKEKPPQNGSSSKDQKEQKPKDKVPEKKEKEVVLVAEQEKEVAVENKNKEVTDKKESQSEAPAEAATPAGPAQPAQDVVVLDDEEDVAPEPTTPSKERKSTRKAGSQQKSPASKMTPSWSPAQKKQAEILASPAKESPPSATQEDVDMEPLTVDASPIRSASGNLNALPAATSTPGRSLFGFRSSSKQSTEVELASQPSSSPAGTPARTFGQITGRRSIRPTDTLTPSKVGSYRCVNSDLDTSSCTNASMNATVGSEIPNSSSFSFSFLTRSRKRERTPPPPVSGSQSTNDLAQDVEMSPPKRARFEMFSFRSLASPFSLLSSKFSKATIATPTRLRLEQTPPGDDDGGEVRTLTHNVVEEENQLNTSSVSVPEAQDAEQASKDVTVGQEAGLETPKKGGSPAKEIPADIAAAEGADVTEQSADGENIPPLVEVAEAEPRSRCSIM